MRRAIVLLTAISLLTGCGPGWHRTDPTPGTAISPTDQFLIHHGASVDRWHALQVGADSISGIPWLKPVDCDSCRVALASAGVDSIRLGHPTSGLWKGYALVMLGPEVILSVICLVYGESPVCWIPPST